MKKAFVLLTLGLMAAGTALGQRIDYRSKYPDVPIVDVYNHPLSTEDAENYLKVSQRIKERYGSDLARWIALPKGYTSIPELKAGGNDHILYAANEIRPHKGIDVSAAEVIETIRTEGYVGLPFWFGDPSRMLEEGEDGIRRIDDPRLEPFLRELESAGVHLSIQISDPNGPFGNRGEWMESPVDFWRQITAFDNFLAKYPNLTVIAGHGAWLICQDAHLDFLRYMLARHPNFYFDMSAVFQYMYLVDRDNWRDLVIEFSDRIMYGSALLAVPDDRIDAVADNYARAFALMETDGTYEGGFYGSEPTRGLDLPREVIERIYYKNALKIYPGLAESLGLKYP